MIMMQLGKKMKMMNNLTSQIRSGKTSAFISIFIILSLLLPGSVGLIPVHASSPSNVTFIDVTAFYQYGIQATFQARLETTSRVTEIVLLIQSGNQPLISQELELTSTGEIIHQLDLKKINLQPYARVSYWFKGRLKDGSTFESEHFSFHYLDNRFSWQNTSDGRFDVFWNSDNLALGDMVLQIALEGLRSAVSYVPVSPPLPVQIFIYSSGRDLIEALELGHLTWVAGHTNPELNLILISLPPTLEQKLELERIIPHEILHILLYQVSGDQTSSLPAWFSEGLASAAELNPNPDFSSSLGQAVSKGSLMPMADLCQDFPPEASLALQAYAQSASFVKFLGERYGITKLSELLQKYSDGMDCESGLTSVYGNGLDRMELIWKQDVLGINPATTGLRNLAPYFFLAILVLAPPLIGISIRKRKKIEK